MNRDENGKLCGDVDYDAVAPVASHITIGLGYDDYHADGADLSGCLRTLDKKTKVY